MKYLWNLLGNVQISLSQQDFYTTLYYIIGITLWMDVNVCNAGTTESETPWKASVDKKHVQHSS